MIEIRIADHNIGICPQCEHDRLCIMEEFDTETEETKDWFIQCMNCDYVNDHE